MGEMLCDELIAFRGKTQRPIILIGHSLGGLLIKEALLHARKKPPSDFSKLCVGLVFFGVPHHGLRNEQLVSIVKGQPNESLVSDLVVNADAEPSTLLRRITSHFAESFKDRLRIISIFEREPSALLQLRPDGKLSKSGDKVLMVTKQSAINIGITVAANEDNIGFDLDHSDLVKFPSRSCGLYKIVEKRIKDLVDPIFAPTCTAQLVAAIYSRCHMDSTDPPHPSLVELQNLGVGAVAKLDAALTGVLVVIVHDFERVSMGTGSGGQWHDLEATARFIEAFIEADHFKVLLARTGEYSLGSAGLLASQERISVSWCNVSDFT
ncbi:hypothetical protein E0Z10_g3540 [Xylaria hypoxylon]|uniref:DUF676 domain-containing protein n=1 Tax=Xylaria hypoxylon TaxID=37992 RepID=A0A4Z0YLR9_9PEZI|nr:hypothetical protein E0Z10_g3540 [Xylaria hypoxylon]